MPMVAHTKAILSRTALKAKEHISGPMEGSIKESGKITEWMEWGLFSGLTVANTKVDIKMT